MKIFLTGGTGFIGNKLVHTLAERGHHVHALNRSPHKEHMLQHDRITIIPGDLNHIDAITAGMKGCKAAFHLAAYARVWHNDPAHFERVNVGGTKNLLEAALEHGLQKVVVTSTGGTIGASGREAADESATPDPALMTMYERSKQKVEALVTGYVERGLPVVIVNPARVFGPGPLNESNGETIVMQRYLEGSFRFLPGDGSSTGSYPFVDDIVQGHILALEKGRPGERYILGGENASFREFFDIVGRLSGKQQRMLHIPIPLIMVFAKVQLFLARNFNRYPAITPELVRKYSRNWSFSSAKANKELGYEFTPLEEAVSRTLEWLEGQ